MLARALFLTILALLCLGSHGNTPALTPTPTSNPDPDAIVNAIMGTHAATMIIKGNVTDEKQVPLENVRCFITTFATGGFEGDMRSERRELQKDFTLRFGSVLHVELTFFKEGYHALVVPFDSKAPETDAAIDGKTQTYLRTFVLKEAGPVPDLYVKNAEIRNGPNGHCVIYRADDLSAEPGREAGRSDRLLEFTTTTLSLSYPYFFTDLRNEPGVTPLREVYNKYQGFDLSPTNAVAELCLLGGDDGDGVLLCTLEPPSSRITDFPSGMSVAPAEGYSPRVDIPQAAFRESTSRLFFYFHVRNSYGKGKATVRYKSGSHRLILFMELFVQPDGSRNVETYND